MGFGAAPVCSETFTMAEDPKAAVGEALGKKGLDKQIVEKMTSNHQTWRI